MAKTKYEKPLLTKLQQGVMNKFGAKPVYAINVRDEIDGVSIDELVRKHGSPLFVFSERTIRETIRKAQQSFITRYPNVTFSWSYKTNYLAAICSIFHQEGCIAEVVSEMEYQKARKLGVPGDQIIFNGPNKSMEILRVAAEENAKIHIDHFDEIDDLEEVAKKLNKTIKVAIRLNLNSGIVPLWTRFGFNLESGQAFDAVQRIKMGGHLELVGLHCHIGTFILDPEAYKTQVSKMLQFAKYLERELLVKIEYFDFGGGFPSKSKLKGTYLSPELTVPNIDKYAEKITEALYANIKDGEYPKIYFESGRALIDEAGYLITTVKAVKRMPDGLKSYVIDAGVNLLYTSTWYKFNLEVDRPVQGLSEPSLLNGPLCMNIDIVDESVILPPLSRGTRLILSPIGAYNVTQWMQFIEFRPAIVMITEDGEPVVIRERENLSDIERREKIPQHLTNIKVKDK